VKQSLAAPAAGALFFRFRGFGAACGICMDGISIMAAMSEIVADRSEAFVLDRDAY